MSRYLEYAHLTWPEIAALPREVPLILPIGQNLAASINNDQPGNSTNIVVLPSLPFGWRGSGLEVSEKTLSLCLGNLISGLREDGFINTHVLAPENINLDLPDTWWIKASGSPQPDFQFFIDGSETKKVVIIPVGHTEQHGFHLPVSTDTVIIEAIGQGIASKANDKALCLPVMPYGVSTHRKAFAGTLNMGGRAFEDFWLEAIDTLVERGFEKFYLISGHGGNCSFLTNIVKYAGERHREIFCATSWLYLSGPAGISALEQLRSSPMGGMGHACELETALMLHLHPERVYMERVVDEMDFISTESYYMDWVEGGALLANPPWEDDTITGAYGAGSMATSEKGAIWLQAAVEEKITHIAEIHQQHHRRAARRRSEYGRLRKT